MKLLLDTHIFVWVLTDAPMLKPSTRRLLESAEVRYVSAVSYWEIAIKVRNGKWPEASECLLSRSTLLDAGFTPLSMDMIAAARAGALAWEHRDPFDRMLVAQALRKRCPLVSYDRAITEQRLAATVR